MFQHYALSSYALTFALLSDGVGSSGDEPHLVGPACGHFITYRSCLASHSSASLALSLCQPVLLFLISITLLITIAPHTRLMRASERAGVRASAPMLCMCVYIYIYIYIYIYMYIYIHVYHIIIISSSSIIMNIYIYICIHMYICICVCMYVYICICVYIYIYTYTWA